MSENLKKQTYGFFELRGKITVTEDTFQQDLKGKNTPEFNYNRMNLKMEDGKGGNFFLNVMDGFNSKKGRIIKAQIKDTESFETLDINFADRHNQEILKNVDDRAFIRVAVEKVESEGKMVWDYKQFLTFYDAMNFLKANLKTDMAVYVRGQQRFSEYNGNLNKDMNIQTFLVLPEDEVNEEDFGFTFKQNILLDKDSVDEKDWEKDSIAYVKGYLYYTKYNKELKQKEPVILTLPLVIRADDEKKEKIKRMIDKFLTVEGKTVRRIQVEGFYNSGYTQGNIKLEDLPEEAVELIEDGIYTEEEVKKIYANRNRVDETVIKRPVIVKGKEGELPQVDYNDTEYEASDLEFVAVKEKVVEIEVKDEDLSFLDDL